MIGGEKPQVKLEKKEIGIEAKAKAKLEYTTEVHIIAHAHALTPIACTNIINTHNILECVSECLSARARAPDHNEHGIDQLGYCANLRASHTVY